MSIDSASKPPGWVIGHVSVKDADKWAEYRSRVPATLAPWGGELVFRGTRRAVLGGEHRHSDTVVLKFPDVASAESWHASPAYQALVALRHAAAEVDLILFDG
jgi:uncharacterized protein (DUF1330 family)